ncbi:MAG TPA: DUF1097 domain-containing protein [Anaerovoracaceae bacterium]|nr:DUF1097 domain-containing protein [Anaerovoracaceae bacterium]
MKTRIPIEIVVGVLAAISCLVTLPGLGLPVWALFIGWAWYFSLGATPSVFKVCYPPVFTGALLAALCLWLINVLANIGMGGMPGTMFSVGLTVFLLMMTLKIPLTSASLPAFNAYSSVFALMYIGGFPDLPIGPILSCTLWAMIGNFLGPIFGYFSIKLTFPVADDIEANE